MDVFRLRDRVTQDYAEYVRSFVRIRDTRIDDFVERNLKEEVLWPQPLIQLNPSFETGGWIDGLVDSASSSFLDELLGRLAQELGPEAFRGRLRLENASQRIRGMADVVIRQRLEGVPMHGQEQSSGEGV